MHFVKIFSTKKLIIKLKINKYHMGSVRLKGFNSKPNYRVFENLKSLEMVNYHTLRTYM